MSAPLNLSKPNRALHVGVILMSGVTELLDVAGIDLLSAIDKNTFANLPEGVIPGADPSQAIDIEHHWVNETGKSAKLTSALTLQPTDSFESCPPLDVALMGAHNIGYQPSEAELAFIRKTYEHCSAFICVCGGFQAPLQAGLYANKEATAPRFMVGQLRKTVPNVDWKERRWHRDGKLWTSGALLNGLDLMRSLGETVWGGEGTLMDTMLEIGAWPIRDVNYRDVTAVTN